MRSRRWAIGSTPSPRAPRRSSSKRSIPALEIPTLDRVGRLCLLGMLLLSALIVLRRTGP
jgi:hypothetical protein